MHLPPNVALVAAIAGIIYLCRRDAREKPQVTGALWLPTLWFVILTTRTISQWFEVLGLPVGGGDIESGTPLDAVVFFALILGGVYILYQRRVQLSVITRYNRLLVCFLVYCLLACLWSDNPFVAFKRWIKILGHPIMVLVLLTEPDPQEAIYLMLKRTAYIFILISIVFIKYFPQWGRGFDGWTGMAHDTGVTTDKNTLGAGAMILGYFWVCYTLRTWHLPKGRYRKSELLLCFLFLGMSAWVVQKAQSTTSLVCMSIGIAFVLFSGRRFVNPYRLGTYVVAVGLTAALLEGVFGIHEALIQALGKDPTLTDRTKVWQDLWEMHINPIIGTGFESFWLGDRLQYMWSKWWWHPVQAHNGYLETYLNLGVIGVFFMVALMVTAFKKGQRAFLDNFEMGRFLMGCVLGYFFYNWTEAAFKALHPVWFVFFLVAMDYPQPEPTEVKVSVVDPRDAGADDDLPEMVQKSY